jgi:hypothetical protein
MRTIAELNLLLHTTAELPTGLKLTTEEFEEGWSFIRRVDARKLEKRIHTRGWNFIRFAAGSLRSGIGDTSQEAIACALKLALRRVSNHSNAVEVEHIELTRYPWFFLARVRVYPYRIQESSAIEMPQSAMASDGPDLQDPAEDHLPIMGSSMPMLKELLVASKIPDTRAA